MHFVVPDHLAYCFSAGRLVFLDIARDRYFTVSPRLSEAFANFVAGQPSDVDDLVRRGLVELGEPSIRSVPVPATRDTTRKLSQGLRFGEVGAVAAALLRTRRSLRRDRFSDVVGRLKRRRRPPGSAGIEATGVICASFMRHRSLIPIPAVCLADSVALLQHLEARGGDADLVFGVVASPFAAHCWLQKGDQILNDHLDRVLAFTPILVV